MALAKSQGADHCGCLVALDDTAHACPYILNYYYPGRYYLPYALILLDVHLWGVMGRLPGIAPYGCLSSDLCTHKTCYIPHLRGIVITQ